MFSDHDRGNTHTPPAIQSPLKKLQRQNYASTNLQEEMPPVHSYAGFDVVLNLSPSEILGIQVDQTDYICGVQANGKICSNSLYCRRHLLKQRNEVRRSMPLECLVAEELKNVVWFRKRRLLTKMYHDCKAYWQKHPSASMTPMTCSRTSCVKDESNMSVSPKCVSLCSRTASGVIVNSEQGAFSLLKQAFMKRLSRSADAYKEDLVTYLFYKLACYEVAGIDMRSRELEARYSMSEDEFEMDRYIECEMS